MFFQGSNKKQRKKSSSSSSVFYNEELAVKDIQEMQFSLNYKGKRRRARTDESYPLAIQHLFSPFYLMFQFSNNNNNMQIFLK